MFDFYGENYKNLNQNITKFIYKEKQRAKNM